MMMMMLNVLTTTTPRPPYSSLLYPLHNKEQSFSTCFSSSIDNGNANVNLVTAQQPTPNNNSTYYSGWFLENNFSQEPKPNPKLGSFPLLPYLSISLFTPY